MKRFTLEQANRALPLVRRIVADVVATYERAATLHEEVETAQGAATREKLVWALDDELRALRDLLAELTEIGCDLKDPKIGLIDFIGRHDGRDVCLCWKLGEDQVGYWHELDAGYAGRRPVDTLEP